MRRHLAPLTVLTFTVRNTGNDTLTIGKLRAPKGYRIEEGLSSSIAPGKSDTFSVRLLGSGAPGARTGQITINNNDRDESPFNFNVTGRGSKRAWQDAHSGLSR